MFSKKYDSVISEFNMVLNGLKVNKTLNRIPKTGHLELEIDEDPDLYMFLENDDFERLRTESDSDEMRISIDTDILELERKKGPKM